MPAPPSPPRAQTQAVVAIVCCAYLVAAAVCAWFLVSDVREVIGPRAFAYGFAFALAPAPFLVALFVLLDRLRPEPAWLMAAALVWGTCIATFIALRANGWLTGLLGPVDASPVRSAVFIAPWVEELAKGAVIFIIVWWQRDRLMSSIGGIVYAGLIGVGFAFTENVVYYGQVFQHALDASNDRGLALDAVRELFWWRGVAAPFVHPMFTLMTGIGIGVAVRQRNTGVRVLAPFAGFLGAVLLHMGYNTLASYSGQRGLTASYIGVLLPLLLAVTLAVVLLRRHERRVLAARLHDYVVLGLLDHPTVDSVATAAARRRTVADAGTHGRQAARDARRRQRDLLDLGALRDRFVRGVSGAEALPDHAALLARVRADADRVRPPQAMEVPAGSPGGEPGREPSRP